MRVETEALTKNRRGSLLLNPSLIGYIRTPGSLTDGTGLADALSGRYKLFGSYY
jgi:hypothetical protein